MNWSLNLGRMFGIVVKVHWTFLLLLIWVFSGAMVEGKQFVPALEAVALITTLFGCVVLHELGHALTARRFGIETRDITLLPIGGIARLEHMPKKPRQEFLVALAGPAVNVVIASVLALLLAIKVGAGHVFTLPVLTETFVGRLLFVNIALAVFNLLPAFPMDGGRVLRALLAMRFDYVTATDAAASVGQMMAILFGVIGFHFNPMLIFIAIFVYLGAQQEAMQTRMNAIINGVPVSAAMITRFSTLNDDDSLGTAAGELLSGDQKDFPVLAAGEFVGVLTRQDLLKAITHGHLDLPVRQLMHHDCAMVRDEDLLEPVLAALQSADCSTVPVSHDGKLVGVVSLDNVGEWLAIQSALQRFATTDVSNRFRSHRPLRTQYTVPELFRNDHASDRRHTDEHKNAARPG